MAKIVFFGTPDYVLPVLDALKAARHEIAAVVSKPPKPVGREQEITPSPVAQWAKERNIEVFDSPLAKTKAEVGIVAAYGRIIPEDILKLWPHGLVNLHPSLLPKYRGPSPIEAAIAVGDKETGITFMLVDQKIDHGPILERVREKIRENDTKESLRERLFTIGANHLPEVLDNYLTGKIKPQEQEHEKAVYTTLIKKEHGFIPPAFLEAALQGEDSNPSILERFIRSLDPWPGTWTLVRTQDARRKTQEKRLKILKAHLEDGKLVLDEVQLEGKKPVSFKQLLEGYPSLAFPS